jgi:hypothetical protein
MLVACRVGGSVEGVLALSEVSVFFLSLTLIFGGHRARSYKRQRNRPSESSSSSSSSASARIQGRQQVPSLAQLYIWGGLLTELLESKQRKLAKQIEPMILRITNPQRHTHTNINIKSKHERPQTKACCEGRSGERSSTSNQ